MLWRKQNALIASDHQGWLNPDWINVAVIPSFTVFTALSIRPFVAGLLGVEVSCKCARFSISSALLISLGISKLKLHKMSDFDPFSDSTVIIVAGMQGCRIAVSHHMT